jgi:hypothetical protein
MSLFLPAIVFAISTAIAGQDQQPAQAGHALLGRVQHAELPVPGALVTAVRGERTVKTTSDIAGQFQFVSLEPGAWTISVETRGFATIVREIAIPPDQPELVVALTMQSYAEILSAGVAASGWPEAAPAQPEGGAEILQGSVVNGAATIVAQPRAVGNNRPRSARAYSGSFTAALGNSAWNAPPYSFGGLPVPEPDYGNAQLTLTVGGPVWIPRVLTNGPMFRATYARGLQHNAGTRSALVPTLAERGGDLSSRAGSIIDPRTGQPFEGNVIAPDRIAPQATALLAYYPLPTGATSTGANFQLPLVAGTTSDRLQVDLNKTLTQRTSIIGTFGITRTLTDSADIFGFTDEIRVFAITAGLTVNRRVSTRLNLRFSYQFTHSDSTTTPYFADRTNVSGEAGISGNAQDPLNWGPPVIAFPDFADLRDANYQETRRNLHVIGVEAQLRRGRHSITFGGDARLHGIDLLTPPDPRGTMTFTGALTGDAFADFLLGVPTTSAIAMGNESARVRGGVVDAYINDDFRIAPGLTMEAGVRWEYESPYTERDGRLSNLDVAPGFTAVSPVVGFDPVGSLTGTRYPAALVHRDLRGLQPRVGVSWRPDVTSSLVVRGAYGIYRNLGVYQSIGMLLAQQPPFSTSFSVHNSLATPLTLASPFPASLPSSTTYAVDPDFRTATVHSFSVIVQRDLPASLTVIAAYFGDRGRSLAQAFLPNTYPSGAPEPCATCPSGFVYLTSGGHSMRDAGVFTLRRRLASGFTATATYTLANAMDDGATFSNTSVAPGSLAVAQDWLDLGAEWGPSAFDQRHLLSVDMQYTSGVGLTGGTLVDSWWGTLFKDWTITAQLNAGSGMPVSPMYFVAVPGTGTVGVRPSLTGVPVSPVEAGSYANAAAFTAPAPGTWGTATRNSIRGPATASFDMSFARVFRFPRRMTLEWRVNAANIVNRVTFVSIDRIVGSPQFGWPTATNQMRRITTSFRFGF